MTRLLASLAAALAIAAAAATAATAHPAPLRALDRVPDDSSLPLAHRVDLGGAHAPARLPDPAAKPRIPAYLKLSSHPGSVHAAGLTPVKEEQFRDEHDHVLTLATDNADVDLVPYANLLASTYHYGEIEYIRVFVTSGANLTRICGSDAAACYAADDPGNSPAGVMIVSYEDADVTHAVIHEYGHHVDNNTYNLGGLSDCGISGDGSRRWFFARQMQDNILDNLSCDPQPGWGQLLPEVFAEDYAQMVGIPKSEYHPAISLPPPTARQKNALRTDMDSPFLPTARRVTGRSSRRGTDTFRFRSTVPVFVEARNAHGVRSVRLYRCAYPGVTGAFHGTCRVVVKTKVAAARYRFRLVVF
jgi:hypothetical protein